MFLHMDKLYFILMTHFMLNKGIQFYSSTCAFSFPKEAYIWQMTYLFVLSPVPEGTTVLWVIANSGHYRELQSL
jgi:hypothetical protein